MATDTDIYGLKAAFSEVFVVPFASHRWASARGRSHWVGLEGWQNSMAGPLSSIVKTGGCGYAYERDDRYFSSVNDPRSLRTRLMEWHSGSVAGIEWFTPEDNAEHVDLAFMQSLQVQMNHLIERASAIEQMRWESTGCSPPAAGA
jgi:hypothetical protein